MRILLLFISTLAFLTLHAQIPCNGEFINTGTAIDVGNCIQLTSNSPGQQGCTWLNTPVDFNQPFTHTMVMNFGNSEAGADGICLVYQPGGPNQCGMTGGAIGAAGIPNSFIVEFDTWDNGAAQSDIAADHCATSIFGDLNNQIDSPVSLGQIEDGADHVVTFEWNPAGTSYTIYFDGVPIISGVYDIINLVFGGNPIAYWGYTSSTGAAFNTQTVCPSLPPPITVDAGIDVTVPCSAGLITLDATNTDFGATYTYSWFSPDGGVIVSGGGTLTPTVMGPGTYILTLTDSNGGCMETDEVVVTLEPLEAIIAPPPFVPCFGNTVFLDGSASSSGPFITYQWTTPDGSIVSGANSPVAEINAPGTYTLTVIYNDGTTICTEEATVQALQDPNIPTAAAVGGTINCFFPTIQLDGSASSSGPDYQYEWTTGDGLILGGANTQFPTVGAAGTYTIIVTNTFNGCFDTFDVLVEEDTQPPVAIAVAEDSLGCQTDQVTLDGTGSSVGGSISYEWSTMDGNIISGVNGITAVVDQPGTYTLFVSDDGNGCFDSESVVVVGGPAALDVVIAPADQLDCALAQATIDATGSAQDTSYTYSWSSSNGNIVSGADGLSPLVDMPGNYVLSISSPDGCVGMDSIEIFQDTLSPVAEAGIQQVLSCDDTSLMLDGTGSSSGSEFIYQWATANGSLVSGSTTLMPVIDAPGLYTLSVSDTSNNCVSQDTVSILSDAQAPDVSIVLPDTLDCMLQQQVLDASASSQGLGFNFTWTTTNGSFVSGQNTLQPTINSGGQYTLSITNLNNNCTTTSNVVVVQDTLAPTVTIAEPDTLDCFDVSININATGSSSGSEFEYQWTTPDGNILLGDQSSMPLVDAAGTYQLMINNTENSCQNTASVVVVQDTVAPVVSLIVSDTLDCTLDTLLLDGSGSDQGGPFNFTWIAPAPGLISNTGSLQATASGAGNFGLTIFNSDNSCQSTVFVEVAQDTVAPVADAGPDSVINCSNPVLVLDGTNSSDGNEIVYQWFGPVDAGGTTDSPEVSQQGEYILEVSNTVNGCQSVDTVSVIADFEAPMIAIATPDILTCTDSLIVLDATASSQGNNFEYSWTTPNGSILSGADAPQSTVSQSGEYYLEIINTDNGCSVLDSTEVEQDVNLPVANIVLPPTLTCDVNSIQLDGTNSTQGGNISFQWSSADGNIVSGGNTLQPVVDAPGTYSLQIVDTDNDCETVAAVVVPIDTLPPLVDAGPAQELNCNFTELSLDGSATVQGSNYIYQWSTTDGNIVSGANGLNPLVDLAGQYTLSVQDTENGCSEDAEVAVTENFEIPYLEIAQPEELNCTTMFIALDATASDTASYISYSWTTSNGMLTGGADVLLTATSVPGAYQLVILNENNGCSDTASVMVMQNIEAPSVQIMPATVLTCTDTTQVLDATASSVGGEFEYTWTTSNGTIISGGATTAPEIGAPGEYQLEILNTLNGCTADSTISVDQNISLPEIGLNQPDVLTCEVLSVPLQAAITNAGNQNYTYGWSTLNGNIQSGSDTNMATVDAAGAYDITIVDEENGCTNTATLEVQQDTTAPEVLIELPDTLNCAATTIQLDATSSSSGFLFENTWMTANGQIVSGATALEPEVAQPGTYMLTIENTANGCESAAAVEVSQDITLPTVAIAEPAVLTCSQTTIALDGSGSSTGSVFTYLWTSENGNITGASQQIMAQADEPGNYTLHIQNQNNGCRDSLEVSVAEDIELPSLSILPPEILTCATTILQLDAQGSSSGSEFEYEWSTMGGNIQGANSLPVITVNAAGAYTLVISNTENGCLDSLDVLVTQDTLAPDVNIFTPEVLNCVETQIQLDASDSSLGAEFTYQWNTDDGNLVSGASTITPVVDAPGLYMLTVTNTENGCSDMMGVNVQENTELPGFVVLPSDTLTCAVQSVALTGTSTGPGNTLSFLWQTENGTINGPIDEITTAAIAPGIYTLFVTNTENGCLDSMEVAVAQDTLSPVAQIQEPETLTCTVQDIQLNGAGSSPGSYQWTTADGNILSGADSAFPIIDAPGSYELTVLSLENGCTETAMIQVGQDIEEPVVSIAMPIQLTCVIDSVQLNASGSSTGGVFEYTWEASSGGNISSGDDTLLPTVNAPGIYELVIINTENGCEQQGQVTVNQNIVPPVAMAGADFVLPCFEPTTQLNGNGSSAGAAYTYEWNTTGGNLVSGGQTLNPSVASAGAYTLLVTNTINGCTDIDEVVVVQEIPTASAELVQPLCFGDAGAISIPEVEGGIPPYVYSVDGGNTFYPSPNFTGLQPGNYEMVVQDVNGCEYEENASLIQPDSMVVMINEVEVDLLLGESHQMVLSTNIAESEIASVVWSNVPGLSCYDCLNPIAMPTQTADYRVEVISDNGCRDQAIVRIYVNKQANVFIPNIFSPNGDGANDVFYIFARAGTVKNIQSFRVFDRWGEPMYEDFDFLPNDPKHGWDGYFNGELMNTAVFVYYAEIEFIDGRVELFKGDITLFR